jgi:hypothetical protein
MKKYLMSGIAAIALCAAFTSCSKGDLYDESAVVEKKEMDVRQAYAQAFEKAFGKVGANVDWGFGPTRANSRTADPRGNMWADEGWNVPPVITDAQKDIVRRYFQQNTPIGYDDPEWSDFWIQQVYKGGTNTENGSQTTEQYRIGNGDMVTGGDHMDHLCSKAEDGTEDHVNDFNNSDNNDWEGRMLMVGSSTYTFGYINSNATAIHYDKAALVKWDVIAQWAVDNGLESSVEESVLNDGWNRSYMGFDWEQALPDDCYRPIYDYNAGWSADLPGGFPILGYETFEFDGKTYKFLSANSNQYAYDENEPKYHGIQNYNDRPSDAIIRELLSLGYLPYSDTLKDWIKLSTGSDGYYSDWIVTLTEAYTETPTTPNYRVIAEDLSADEASDFDFNDVVFDIIPNEGTTKAYIKLIAAGGIYKLTVNGIEVHEAWGEQAVDGRYPMINTGAGPEHDPIKLCDLDGDWTGDDVRVKIKNIVIKVYKPGFEEGLELTATTGEAACKILVDTRFGVVPERKDISNEYDLFTSYVQGYFEDEFWWRRGNRPTQE